MTMKTKLAVAKEEGLKILKEAYEAAKIASFYGFLPIQAPKVTPQLQDTCKSFDPEWRGLEKAAILKNFSELRGSSIPSPTMLYIERPFPGTGEKKRKDRIECELAILGSQRSVCEGLCLQAARAILEQSGWKNTLVRINSVGNKESVADFERKMGNFIRKRMGDMSSELRQEIKKDLFFLTRTSDEKYAELRECAPQSVDCLSEQSRLHLKEMLEFLEATDYPYVFDSSLIGEMKFSTEIIFEIVADSGEGEVLARGCRWNRLSRKFEYKKEVPSVSVSVSAKALKPQKVVALKQVQPKFYLVQFGPEAKQKSFLALEELRKAGVNVSHSLAKDKLGNQMFSAEQNECPYIILIGQKEAIQKEVVIRNVSTRAQYTVPISELGNFIKRSVDFK